MNTNLRDTYHVNIMQYLSEYQMTLIKRQLSIFIFIKALSEGTKHLKVQGEESLCNSLVNMGHVQSKQKVSSSVMWLVQ